MRKYIFLIVINFTFIYVKSQEKFIIAGNSLSTTVVEFSPNVSINSQSGYSYELDIDNNEIIDLYFFGYNSSGTGGFFSNNGVYLNIYNGEILCNSSNIMWAFIFNEGDTIKNSNSWSNSNSKNITYHSVQYCPPTCPSSSSYTNCSLDNKYLGYRLFNNSDTIYYWVKFSSNNCHLILKAYSSNIVTDIFEENVKVKKQFALTNPTFDILYLNGIDTNHDIYYEIYNLQSARIKQAALHKPEVDVSDLPDGIYVLKLHTPDGVLTRKIIKMQN
jgi:hypothetical protein